jgi:hypothetical protein
MTLISLLAGAPLARKWHREAQKQAKKLKVAK